MHRKHFLRSEKLENSKKRSKRNRSLTFDVSRSSISSPMPKLNKKSTMQNPNANVEPTIRDLSGSITNSDNRQPVLQSNPSTHPIKVDNLVRSLVQESLNHATSNLHSMVQDTVTKEMEKIYGVIDKLSEAVSRISVDGRNAAANPTVHPEITRQYSRPSDAYRPYNDNFVPQFPPQNMDYNPNLHRRNTFTLYYDFFEWSGVEVERFGINFSDRPNSLSIEDFIYRLKYFQHHYDLAWEDFLNGSAVEWFWLHQRNNCISDWQSLKHGLIERFKTRIQLIRFSKKST